MTAAYRSIHEFRRLLHESSLRRATALLKSVSSSAETVLCSVDLYSEMEPCNLVSVRDASAQHKCTVQMVRLGRAPKNYRYPLPSSTTTATRHISDVSLIWLYHYWRALPTSGRLEARKALQVVNVRTMRVMAREPRDRYWSTPSRFQDSVRGLV